MKPHSAYASIGNHHFFTTCHRQKYQNYQQKLGTYRKVASSNKSRLEANAGFFRLLMKGIFDPYVL